MNPFLFSWAPAREIDLHELKIKFKLLLQDISQTEVNRKLGSVLPYCVAWQVCDRLALLETVLPEFSFSSQHDDDSAFASLQYSNFICIFNQLLVPNTKVVRGTQYGIFKAVFVWAKLSFPVFYIILYKVSTHITPWITEPNELFLGKISIFKRKILNESNVYIQNSIIK